MNNKNNTQDYLNSNEYTLFSLVMLTRAAYEAKICTYKLNAQYKEMFGGNGMSKKARLESTKIGTDEMYCYYIEEAKIKSIAAYRAALAA